MRVDAPTKSAKEIEKIKQNNTADLFIMVLKKAFNPHRSKTDNVNNISTRLSIDESKVDIFLDSQI